LLGTIWSGSIWGASAATSDLAEAQKQFLSGNYSGCVNLAQKALQEQPGEEEWELLLSRVLLATGRYPEALKRITNAVADEPRSIRLRWQAREVFLCNGQVESAAEMLEAIVQRVNIGPSLYRDASSLVVFGQAALLKGADPKRVLDTVFEAARKSEPNLRDVYLAAGGLALDKHDFALAAKKFEEGLKQSAKDPDLLCGLAQAYAPSEAGSMADALETALERNSNHLGSLLLLVDHSIDAEDYSQAAKLLDQIKAVNQWHPDAWSYRAVLAHLGNQPADEKQARQTALKFWNTNPRVDHLIGLKLSQKYRFAESAEYQRQALQFDPDYLPAKAQLAQDLLRMGDEAAGWKLAEEVQKQDGYDVEAYNLVNLHETMAKFTTLTNENFLLRMGAHEAAIYGQRALNLLERARSNLSAKYGVEVKRPTIVEVFPQQKDFAVRTFGMPGNPGYLGVCFGSLVTANSPAAHPGHPINWQAVLWHEFCHVVTLQKTRNKMPRWLSEGISVYEEAQANPSWGQRMNPRYREMVLGDELTPVSKLSGAFLMPRSDMHLQFAYYESSLVVEFLVQKFGIDHLKAILADLGEGIDINLAIEQHTEPMKKLEDDFASFARDRANGLAPGLDWEQPNGGDDFNALLRESILSKTNSTDNAGPDRRRGRQRGRDGGAAPVPRRGLGSGNQELTDWIARHPTNFYALSEQARMLLEQKKYEEAKTPLEKLVELYPTQTGNDSAYAALAATYRALGRTNDEHRVLVRYATADDEATDAYRRLMELDSEARDWPAVAQNALQYLAVDPLVPLPYRSLAEASEKTGDLPVAISACRALLELDPADPAEAHFHLAQLLHRTGQSVEARRQVLQALEEAPRYRAALRLLLELNGKSPQTQAEAKEADRQGTQ
jgi:tetratricopeptide (TPR) repeat protein